jgi:hypothetical protein
VNIPALVRRGVKTVERAAGSVRVPVVHYPVTGRDAFGPTYGAPIPREAFMEFTAEGLTLPDGTETVSRAILRFMGPVAIGDRDQFEVPDGSGGTMRVNVQAVRGPMDVNNVPYAPEVWLGETARR